MKTNKEILEKTLSEINRTEELIKKGTKESLKKAWYIMFGLSQLSQKTAFGIQRHAVDLEESIKEFIFVFFDLTFQKVEFNKKNITKKLLKLIARYKSLLWNAIDKEEKENKKNENKNN